MYRYDSEMETIEEYIENGGLNYDEDFEYLYKILKKRYKRVTAHLVQLESKMDRIEELILSMQSNMSIPTETDSSELMESTPSQPITCTIRLGEDS